MGRVKAVYSMTKNIILLSWVCPAYCQSIWENFHDVLIDDKMLDGENVHISKESIVDYIKNSIWEAPFHYLWNLTSSYGRLKVIRFSELISSIPTFLIQNELENLLDFKIATKDQIKCKYYSLSQILYSKMY